MDLVALWLFILVGYSVGVALASRGRVASPGLPDLGFLVLLWVGGSVSRLYLVAYLNRWVLVGLWFLVALFFALLWTSTRRARLPLDAQPAQEKEGNLWSRLWARWKGFARRMGNFQGRVLLALFYFVIITPFALVVRLFGDPLHVKRRQTASWWLNRPPAETELEN